MQRIFLITWLAAFFCLTAAAADEKNIVSSTLRSATVYRVGAELLHTARATLDAGKNELIIDGISNSIDINSLQLSSGGKVSILSVEYATDFMKPVTKTASLRKLEDSLGTVDRQLSAVQAMLKTDIDLLDLLKANKQMGGQQTGLSVAELMKMVDYYKVKTLELQNEISRFKEKEKLLIEKTETIKKQISEETLQNTRTIGKLLLQLNSPTAGSYEFAISYLTQTAYWNPHYDIRIDAISKPATLVYRAKLVQASGIDWKQVKLTLSTSTPNQTGNAPVFTTWFLRYNNPVVRLEDRLKANTIPGFRTESAQDNREAIAKGSVSGEQNEPPDYVSVQDRELNINCDIDLPYDVPSNGKEQTLTLQELSVPAQYKFYTVPKLDRDAFLLAEIADWEKLNLLPGQANILFEGVYVGKSFIDPQSTQDTLNLTLGRDKRLVVKRELLADYSNTRFLGNDKKQVFTYETTLKNNKKEKVQLVLKDQYPVSTEKDIAVELTESSKAMVNADTGVLTWKIELEPGETRKVKMSYSLKYAKDRTVM